VSLRDFHYSSRPFLCQVRFEHFTLSPSNVRLEHTGQFQN
jgi:hypothetical protein